jgi:signal transduction histidine kinase
VKSLLRFCREEPAARQHFDLRDVIRFVESITRTYALEQQCRITVQLADEPLTIQGNPMEMEIMLVNLVRNAIEARSTEVVLSATRGEGWHDIRVADNGCGIADSDTDRLCDPFFTTRRKQGGTGLGLSIVHSIVQELGGVIDFVRNADRGMTVCLKLPELPQELN